MKLEISFLVEHVRRYFALLVPDDILEFLHSSAERDMSRLNFDFFRNNVFKVKTTITEFKKITYKHDKE